MMRAKNQLEAIKIHLIENGQITSLEAIKKYGVTRLAHYIYLLRKEGVNIETKNVSKKNRFGQVSTFANYKLIRK